MEQSPVEPEPLELPQEGEWVAWLEQHGRDALADAAAHVAALKDAPRGDTVVLSLWNDLNLTLSGLQLLAGSLSEVHPEESVTDVTERLEREARQLTNDLLLDAEVYAALAAVDADGLEAPTRRVLELALRDFRRAGVDRDEETRERLHDLNRRLDERTQAFAKGIREGLRTVRVPASSLDGLPPDFVEEHPADEDGTVELTSAYPDTIPFLTFSRDGDARRTVAHAAANVAWPENDAVLADMLELRAQKADLLGYADWPSYDAEVKMIGSGDAIPEFLDRLAATSQEQAQAELAVYEEAARAEGEDRIDSSTWRRYVELVKNERFDVDDLEVRRYLHVDKVMQGILDVTSALFGITWTPVDTPAWHSDVRALDATLAENGQRLGRVFLDLHPRERKFNHAAVFGLVPGLRGRQLPQGSLVCNVPRGLLGHDDVVMLFHEFGHLVHFVLSGRHDWVRFSGLSAEWDFIEAPSMMLERWAWDTEVLRSFATDDEGEPIPAALVERMRAAEEFGKAFWVRRQLGLSAVSYRLHRDRPEDRSVAVPAYFDAYSLVGQLPDEHLHANFGHLEGYTSAYYTYMWSLVIAQDLLSAFDPDDLLATEVAHRYRDTVLAAGASRPAAELVTEFLGRPYDDTAFRAWLEGSR